jgi:uncharacterized protein YbaP (TraB family)
LQRDTSSVARATACSDLRSGHTYFVVVGAGQMGGRNSLLALLRSHGYQIEQL